MAVQAPTGTGSGDMMEEVPSWYKWNGHRGSSLSNSLTNYLKVVNCKVCVLCITKGLISNPQLKWQAEKWKTHVGPIPSVNEITGRRFCVYMYCICVHPLNIANKLQLEYEL